MMLVYLAIYSLVVNVEATNLRIFNGEDADRNEYKFMVKMTRKFGERYYFVCGGSLFAKHWVITAAHCIYDDDGQVVSPSEVKIHLGDYSMSSLDPGEVRVGVKRIIPHENYYSFGYHISNDIALIEMEQYKESSSIDYIHLPTNETFQKLKEFLGLSPDTTDPYTPRTKFGHPYYPIYTPPANMYPEMFDNMVWDTTAFELGTSESVELELDPYRPGANITVIGWGGMENGNIAEVLQKLTYNVASFAECSEMWPSHVFIYHFCTHVHNAKIQSEHTWNGDSGGPLFHRYRNASGHHFDILLGLVSYGDPVPPQDSKDVNTNVIWYIDWILSHYMDLKPNNTATFNLVGNENDPIQGKGILVVHHPGETSPQTFCRDGFNPDAAQAVCRYLGFLYGVITSPNRYMDQNMVEDMNFGYTNVKCEKGQMFQDCSMEKYGNSSIPCFPGEEVAISCSYKAFLLIITGVNFKINRRNGQVKGVNVNIEAEKFGILIPPDAIGVSVFKYVYDEYEAELIAIGDLKLKMRKGAHFASGKIRGLLDPNDSADVCIVVAAYLHDFPKQVHVHSCMHFTKGERDRLEEAVSSMLDQKRDRTKKGNKNGNKRDRRH